MIRSTGQWTGTSNGNFWYYRYDPEVAQGNLNIVLMMHGSGEGGLADGSQLSRLELNGYPRYIKHQFKTTGVELPFTVIAPQGIKNPGDDISSFSAIRRGMNAFLATLNPTRVVITGLSQGGQEVAIWCFKGIPTITFDNSVIDGFFPVAGRPAGTPDYAGSPDKPFYAIGGENDTSVAPIYTVQMVNGFNSVAGKINEATYDIIPGANHGTTYTRAYNISDTYGVKLYNAILSALQTADPNELLIPC